MDQPPRYPPLYPTRFGGALYAGYRYPFTPSIQPSGSRPGALAGRRHNTPPARPASPPACPASPPARPASPPVRPASPPGRPASPPGRHQDTPPDNRPWPRNGSSEFVTQLAVEDMFANSPEPHGPVAPVSGPSASPAGLSAPITRVSGPFAPHPVSSGPSVPEPARRGPSAPIRFIPAPFAHQPASASPSVPMPARHGAFARVSLPAGPSTSSPAEYGPFAFSPSDFLDENVPPPAPSPLPSTMKWAPAPEEPTAAARLRSATDYQEFNVRPMLDFDAPQERPRRNRYRRARARGDERMADEDHDQDPEECSTERVGRSMSRTQDGYDSDSWRRHNTRLNRLRRAGNQNRQARSLASRRNESKKRKESPKSDEETGSEEKRLKKMSLAEDGPEAGGR